jgi:hypothetical protein
MGGSRLELSVSHSLSEIGHTMLVDPWAVAIKSKHRSITFYMMFAIAFANLVTCHLRKKFSKKTV